MQVQTSHLVGWCAANSHHWLKYPLYLLGCEFMPCCITANVVQAGEIEKHNGLNSAVVCYIIVRLAFVELIQSFKACQLFIFFSGQQTLNKINLLNPINI